MASWPTAPSVAAMASSGTMEAGASVSMTSPSTWDILGGERRVEMRWWCGEAGETLYISRCFYQLRNGFLSSKLNVTPKIRGQPGESGEAEMARECDVTRRVGMRANFQTA